MNTEEINTPPLRIGDQAPVFDAVTTQGKIHFPVDFNGQWIILFSHPSDFTPVCTSEFIAFGSMAKEFEALNCRLIGLSVDGLYSHIAWLRTIKEKIEYKDQKFRYPVSVNCRFKCRNCPIIRDAATRRKHYPDSEGRILY